MAARKKPLTIHDFPEVDLGDNHFIHAKNLFVKHNTDNFYRVYILHIRKYCYDENKNPRFVLIDENIITKIVGTDLSINLFNILNKHTNDSTMCAAVYYKDGQHTVLAHILFGKPPKDKVFIYINSTLDVRKESIAIGAGGDRRRYAQTIFKPIKIHSNIQKRKINGVDIITTRIAFNTKNYSKSFSIKKFGGEENARKLATEWRNVKQKELEEKFPLISPT